MGEPSVGWARLDVAGPADIPDLLALRDALAGWLIAGGIKQWRPGDFRAEHLSQWVDRGDVRVLREDGRLIATAAVLDADPIWPPDEVSARYVHLLMVARSHAGRGLGNAVLAAAEKIIQDDGHDEVRLDAVATNQRLISWYLDKGYAMAGTAAFDDPSICPTVLAAQAADRPDLTGHSQDQDSPACPDDAWAGQASPRHAGSAAVPRC